MLKQVDRGLRVTVAEWGSCAETGACGLWVESGCCGELVDMLMLESAQLE
jgi:hypothetical protein